MPGTPTLIINHTRRVVCRAGDYCLIDIIPDLDYQFKTNPTWHHTDRIEIMINPTIDQINQYAYGLGYQFDSNASEYFAMLNTVNEK
jgi:hypothetical protein